MKPVINKSHYPNGNIKTEYYYLNDKFHREDGSAIIRYYETGAIQYEEYYLYNKLHREDGPAIIYYWENGDIYYKFYYLTGKPLTESEWLIHCRKKKLKSINNYKIN